MSNRAALRTNIHEDQSHTFDVLLSDGPDGENTIEINCKSEVRARTLIEALSLNGFTIQSELTQRFDE